jgi:FimV-like protein
MCRRQVSLLLLWVAVGVPSAGFANRLPERAVERNPVTVGRYSTVEPKPLPYQKDLFGVVIRIGFPRGVDTVGQALEHLLARSGYHLAPLKASCPSMPILLSWPLPAVHRELGPMTFVEALKTLAGLTHHLVIDPVHRLASFQVRETYRALITEPTYRPAKVALPAPKAIASPENTNCNVCDSTLASTHSKAKVGRYGPIQPKEELWSIAQALRAHSQFSTERLMMALLRTNPEAFCFNNINCLKVGAYLEPPHRNVLAGISDADARAEARRQYQVWIKRARDNAQNFQRPEEHRP